MEFSLPMAANKAKIALEKMRGSYYAPTGVPLGAALDGGPAVKRMTVAEKKEQERVAEEARVVAPPAPAAEEAGEAVKPEEATEPVKKEETGEPVKMEVEAEAEPVKAEEATGDAVKAEDAEPKEVSAQSNKYLTYEFISTMTKSHTVFKVLV